MKYHRNRLILIGFLLLFAAGIHNLLFAQEKVYLGEGFLALNGEEEPVFVEKGVLYLNTRVVVDTVAWVQSGGEFRPLFYPNLIKGSETVIRLHVVMKHDSSRNADIFIQCNDSLEFPYSLNTVSSSALIMRNSRLLKGLPGTDMLNGEIILMEKIKNEYALNIRLQLKQRDDSGSHSYDLRLHCRLPSYNYREMDLTTPVVKKAQQKVYRRNMQLAGIMVMLFLAIFFFN